MTEAGDIGALRQFFSELPDDRFSGTRTRAGRTTENTYGNPDIPGRAHRRRFFPDPGALDAYITDTGLDTSGGSEYLFVVYNADGSATLYIDN